MEGHQYFKSCVEEILNYFLLNGAEEAVIFAEVISHVFV